MQIVIVVLLVLALDLAHALAHVSETGQDYSHYFQRNGGFCCNNLDCRPVRYEFTQDGHLIMFPMGRAVMIDPAMINEKPSTDGNAHWCGLISKFGRLETLCAILPPGNAQLQTAPSTVKVTWHD
jgi:hypothetical protein